MKMSSFAGALAFVFTFTTIVCIGSNVAAQAAKPQAPKPGSATKSTPAGGLTAQQTSAVHTAWMNLNRAYLDLLKMPPDVKGDTSRLEGAIKASIEDLHQLDRLVAAPPSGAPQDTGQPRERVFKAVRQHLDLAGKTLQDSQIKSSYCEHALAQIAHAQRELNTAMTAPVRK
jgi:hypothetical protein